ncbi:MAG: precorrin-3B C(17)-methyltransferase, partial [Alphaproteobacteria bacterium]|nr:precorrin-3B C(17)-methyltransferase [Alphaproteobacteria bacterium]
AIPIRALAPILSDKMTEPPVLAIDANSRHVMNLLGQHHGGKFLARMIIDGLENQPEFASPSPHAANLALSGDYTLEFPPPGWCLANYNQVSSWAPPRPPKQAGYPTNIRQILKSIYAKLAENSAAVTYYQDSEQNLTAEIPWLVELGAKPTASLNDADILVTVKNPPELDSDKIILHPPQLVLGVGASRGASGAELIAWCAQLLQQHAIEPAAIAVITSIDVKCDEAAINELAAHYQKPLRFFPARTLLDETEFLTERSQAVFNAVGCYGVAEASALAACRDPHNQAPVGRLLISKQKSAMATLALAQSPHDLDPTQIGHKRGSLCVVGIGPGAADYRSPAAHRAIRQADEIVGYGLYLDLVADICPPQSKCKDFPLGAERERVAYGMAQAALGKNVALISSGDAGIYAMASLACEMLESTEDSAQRRITFAVIPGISAMQTLAAKVGGAIGHDFAAISLSDLLTPWSVIEQRLRHAAAGDFVIALYNPRSHRRDWQLNRAIEIIAPTRPATTPVAYGRNLGRNDEQVVITDLAGLTRNQSEIDMMTIILIGNAASRQFTLGEQRIMFAPRGYKIEQDMP